MHVRSSMRPLRGSWLLDLATAALLAACASPPPAARREPVPPASTRACEATPASSSPPPPPPAVTADAGAETETVEETVSIDFGDGAMYVVRNAAKRTITIDPLPPIHVDETEKFQCLRVTGLAGVHFEAPPALVVLSVLFGPHTCGTMLGARLCTASTAARGRSS